MTAVAPERPIGSSPLGAFNDRELQWRDLASCIGLPDEVFFPPKGGAILPAKRACRACLVRDECLDFALTSDEPYGIWGGMTRPERANERRRRARRTAQAQG